MFKFIKTSLNRQSLFFLTVLTVMLFLTATYLIGCSGGSHSNTPANNNNNTSSVVVNVTMNPETPNKTVSMQGVVSSPIQLFSQLELIDTMIVKPQGESKPVEILSQHGSGFMIALPNNRVELNGQVAVFSSQNVDPSKFPKDQMAFNTYRFRMPEYISDPGKDQTLSFSWLTPPKDFKNTWIGLSNVSTNEWDWFNIPEDNTLTLESYKAYLSTKSELIAVVVVNGVEQCELSEIKVGGSESRGIGLISTSVAPGTIPEFRTESRTLSALPASYDLAANCAPIRDQGSWGSCATFATGDGAMNYSLKQTYGANWNLADNKFKVAPAWLYIKSGADQGLNCTQGRILPYLLESLKVVSTRTSIGAASETNAPYNTSTCTPSWAQAATDDASVQKIDSYSSINCSTDAGIITMKSVIADQQKPLVFGTEVDNAFMNYSNTKATTPVWNFAGPSIGGHAMLVVGYDDTKSAFKVRNSWSTGWGFSGYCWIGYQTFKTKVLAANGFGPYVITNNYKDAVAKRFGVTSGTPTVTPPTSVAASDGAYTNKIKISWAASATAKTYSIYRDTTATPIATGITLLYYEDLVTDGNLHTYKLASVNGTTVSSFSTTDTGYLTQLVAPSALTASDASATVPGKIEIKISPPATGVTPTNYRLYRATSSTGTYTIVAQPTYSATTISYLDATVASGTTYYYKAVSAKANWPDSGYSVVDSGSAKASLTLNPPSKIVASDGTVAGGVDVQIYAPTGGLTPTGYKLYRATTATGTYTLVNQPLYSATFSLYKDTAVVVGGTYYYKAVSYKTGSIDSGYCTYDSGYPKLALNAPSNIIASDATIIGIVEVKIYPPVGGEKPTGYKLYRSTASAGTYTLISQPLYSATYITYNDSTAVPGSTYYYKALSYKSGYADSAYSKIDTGIAKLPLNAPSNLIASDNTILNTVEVKIYPPTTGVTPTNYRLYRSTASAGTYALIGQPVYASPYVTFNDTTTVVGTTYYYKAVSYKSGYTDSVYSKIDSGMAKLPLNAPSNLIASDNTVVGKVEVKIYPPTSGAIPTSYKLYRSTTSTGTYTLLSQPVYSATYAVYNDATAVANTVYYYKAVSYKSGYTDSIFSKIDSGSRK